MRIEQFRRKIAGEVFDYPTLMQALAGYASPRAKVTQWLRAGLIQRVKKGLYVFGKDYARRPYSRELLANLIYGPSYISLESALQYHGLIPEGVASVTSATSERPRRFSTPIGLFLYRRVPCQAYALGVDQVKGSGEVPFLMATPEKALADKIHDDRGAEVKTFSDVRTYLLESLRIPSEKLNELDLDRLSAIATGYHSRKLDVLCRALRRSHAK